MDREISLSMKRIQIEIQYLKICIEELEETIRRKQWTKKQNMKSKTPLPG